MVNETQHHGDEMDSIEDEPAESISKSQKKHDHAAIQDFVRDLIPLPKKQLAQLQLPDFLREDIVAATKLTKSALKRQIGFIAKRLSFEEYKAAERVLIQITAPQRQAVAEFHQIELWRDRLLGPDQDEQSALLDLLVNDHDADRQQLRQMIRGAQSSHRGEKAQKTAARKLFQYLKQLHESKSIS